MTDTGNDPYATAFSAWWNQASREWPHGMPLATIAKLAFYAGAGAGLDEASKVFDSLGARFKEETGQVTGDLDTITAASSRLGVRSPR